MEFLIEVVPTTRSQHGARFIGYVILGVCAAWVSVELHPVHVLTSPTAQRAWLFVSPLAAGMVAFLSHALFWPREKRGWPVAHAAALAATFTTCRFFLLQLG
jgi:hypothetical protein